MNTCAVESYEFGERRHRVLRMPECLFHAGRLKTDALSAANTKLAELDARLQVCREQLEERQKHRAEILPFPLPESQQPQAFVPFMITKAMCAQLLARGCSDEQIRTMTPAEACGILGIQPAAQSFDKPTATAEAQGLTDAEPEQVQRPREETLPEDTFDLVFNDGELVPRAQSQKNIALALRRLTVQPTYDEFAQQTNLIVTDLKRRRQRTEPLTDINERELWLAIDKYFRFLPSRELFRNVLLNEANKYSYHPVREYLDCLKWDGTPRIHHWLVSFAGAPDTEYVRQVSTIVLIAAVRRVRQPGAKFDEMVVLESSQGTEKSSGLRALCPNPDWFTDCLPLNAPPKEVIEQTAGKWIVEVAELSGIYGARIEQLKAMLSRQVDSARMAYGHHRVDAKRQWVAFGTTNDSEYLKDDTGNRRFWPVTVQKFDVPGITAVRDQLWAEAASREASGDSIRLHEQFWKDAAKEQEQRYTTDPWEDELRHNLSIHTWPKGVRRVTRRELYAWIGKNIAHAGKKDNVRLKAIMTRLGWRPMTVNVNGKNEQGYGLDP